MAGHGFGVYIAFACVAVKTRGRDPLQHGGGERHQSLTSQFHEFRRGLVVASREGAV